VSGPIALELQGLRVELLSGEAVVEDISLEVAAGQVFGLVGESGSGKTTTALALLGYATPGTRIVQGVLVVENKEFDLTNESSIKPLRGGVISYVPQDPGGALNPSLRVGGAVGDVLEAHALASHDYGSQVEEVLKKMHLPDPATFVRRFPHQLSGGQQQRVCIGIAIVCEPSVIVLDEPTTGLDVVTQARILEEVDRLKVGGHAIVYVSHNLAVVANIADRIAVMYAGSIIEVGPAAEVLSFPRHPYTLGLLASVPDHRRPRLLQAMPGVAVGVGERPLGCAFAARCSLRIEACDREPPAMEAIGKDHLARCLRWRDIKVAATREPSVSRDVPALPPATLVSVENLHLEHRSRSRRIVAAENVSFTIPRAACIALVGESGSGKTTIARAIAGLHPVTSGRILLESEPLLPARRRTREQHRRIQIVFQNPGDTLNPVQTVREAISRPARILRHLSRRDADKEVDRLLEEVRLPRRVETRYPRELSGGERQRVSIARALAAGPELIICDEITSALDVSVQAAVLLLLGELRLEHGLSLLVITHDLGVVASVAEQTLVLRNGALCEQGASSELLRNPRHPYTQSLIDAAPSLEGVGSAGSAPLSSGVLPERRES
jgi:peptide/nickel transport system ATP-binding protein